ncbi:hypothetical protein GGF50DRAFT_93202, partial [Schizophyllum commune]
SRTRRPHLIALDGFGQLFDMYTAIHEAMDGSPSASQELSPRGQKRGSDDVTNPEDRDTHFRNRVTNFQLQTAKGVSDMIEELKKERDTALQKCEINQRNVLRLRVRREPTLDLYVTDKQSENSGYMTKYIVELEKFKALTKTHAASVEKWKLTDMQYHSELQALEREHAKLKRQLEAADTLHSAATTRAQELEAAIGQTFERLQTRLDIPEQPMDVDEVSALEPPSERLQLLDKLSGLELAHAETERMKQELMNHTNTIHELEQEIESRALNRLEEMQVELAAIPMERSSNMEELEIQNEQLREEFQNLQAQYHDLRAMENTVNIDRAAVNADRAAVNNDRL